MNLITDTTLSITPGILWGIAWKGYPDFKDLSFQGACSLGFSHEGALNHGLQFFNTFKNQEKHSDFRWAVTIIPILTNLFHECITNGLNCDMKDLKLLPKNCFNILKENTPLIKVIGFLSTTIPLYNMTRSVKNSIWKSDDGFDPSGHVMFKIIQQGMLFSTLTLKNNVRVNTINICFVLTNILADTAMLANTTANCHTMNEVLVGAALGMTTLATSLLVNRMVHKLFNNLWS